nr:hypothetical protein [Tanacetum cinerariifolium]
MSITSGNRPRLSKVEDFILPNYDADKVLPDELQRNTTDPSVVVTDSSASNYDLADESSLCSTPLPPLEKLAGANPVSGPQTIKSISKSNSTFKAETLKGVIFNESSSAPTKGNISTLVSKTNSTPAVLFCKKYKRTDHRTCDHAEVMSSRKVNQHYIGQELTNEEIRNSNAYKEYYTVATGVAPPKPKASVWRTRSSFDTSITPPTAAAGPRLTTSQKGKQAAKASKAKNEGTGSILGVPNVPTDESEEELSWNSTDDEGDADEEKDGDDDQEVVRDDDKDDEKDDEEEGEDDEQGYNEEAYDEETRDEERFDPIPQTPKNSDDEGNGDEDLGLNVGGEEGMESIFETTSQMDVQTLTSVAPLPMTAPTMTPSTIATITTTSQAPIPPTIALSFLIDMC